MQLETIAVAVRPRSGFEALDLGLRMAASWWRPVWSTWLAVVLPVALVLHGALWSYPLVASLLLWWLKPAFDRFVLHVVSRCVFGTPPRLTDTLRDWRAILLPGLFAALTWRRLDPARSFNLPVLQLEGQNGRAGAARRRLLGQRMRGVAIWLTLACAHFVAILQLAGAFLFLQLLPVGDAPENAAQASQGLLPNPEWWQLSDSLLYLTAECVIEPFFVAGGFALYLSRRVMLEGWDIELALRRMAARIAARGAPRRAVAALLLAGLCALAEPARAADCATAPAPAHAASQDVADDSDADDDEDDEDHASDATPACPPDPSWIARKPLDSPAHKAIVEVLADPIFGSYQDVDRWRYRFEREQKEAEPRSTWWRKVGKLFGQLMQGLSWVVIGAVLIAIIVVLARRWGEQRASDVGAVAAPTVLFGLKIAPETLPEDIASAAAALLDAGQLRAALSLIYRGALSNLVHVRGLRVLAGDTEGEALANAQALLPPAGRDYFAQLVAQWIAVAYARRAPELDAVRASCAEFDRHFARAAPAAPDAAPAGVPA